jgi:hypothetical protein
MNRNSVRQKSERCPTEIGISVRQPPEYAGEGVLTLSWPAWATDYRLCSATNLASPIVWAPVTNAATAVGDQYVVTLPVDPTDQRFLQLQRSVNPGQVLTGTGRSP